MHAAFITFSDGNTAQALILAKGRDYMRVAVPGWKDASELRLEGDQWMCDRQRVALDSIVGEDGSEIPSFAYGDRVFHAGE